MNNMPELKIGVVAVSRDCFPESLSVSRREALMKAYKLLSVRIPLLSKKNTEKNIFTNVRSVS